MKAGMRNQFMEPAVKPTAKGENLVDPAEACLIAAEQIQRKLMAIRRKIDKTGNPNAKPNNPLPVDHFPEKMAQKKSAPRVILKPRKFGKHLYTASITAYVYAEIEAAFVRAGGLSGGNRAGYLGMLRKLLKWIGDQEKRPDRAVPKWFIQRTSLLFRQGILEDSRKRRIEVIMQIGTYTPTKRDDLAMLKSWVEDDLADVRLTRQGRPPDYQKIIFAAEIANLWKRLTGRPISKGPETNFARFLVACWESGFTDTKMNSNFKRILRHHIGERTDPCDRCKKCGEGGKCDQIRHFGILFEGEPIS